MRSAESSAEPRAKGHGSSGETGRTECEMMNAECEITERENRRNGDKGRTKCGVWIGECGMNGRIERRVRRGQACVIA